jgi:archaellin
MASVLSTTSIADLIAEARAHLNEVDVDTNANVETETEVDLTQLPDVGVVEPIEVTVAPTAKQDGVRLTNVRIVIAGTSGSTVMRYDFASPEVTIRAAGQKGQRFAIKHPTEIK